MKGAGGEKWEEGKRLGKIDKNHGERVGSEGKQEMRMCWSKREKGKLHEKERRLEGRNEMRRKHWKKRWWNSSVMFSDISLFWRTFLLWKWVKREKKGGGNTECAEVQGKQSREWGKKECSTDSEGKEGREVWRREGKKKPWKEKRQNRGKVGRKFVCKCSWWKEESLPKWYY